jgi:hypothetical protein
MDKITHFSDLEVALLNNILKDRTHFFGLFKINSVQILCFLYSKELLIFEMRTVHVHKVSLKLYIKYTISIR